MPFEEIQHTADWCLRVWAADLPTLFEESARGMNGLSGMVLASAPPIDRTFTSSAPDPETLLVSFLSELVFFTEQERIGFNQFAIRLYDNSLIAGMKGAPIVSLNKTIKAVTYHNLHIQKTDKGYEVEIVFDV